MPVGTKEMGIKVSGGDVYSPPPCPHTSGFYIFIQSPYIWILYFHTNNKKLLYFYIIFRGDVSPLPRNIRFLLKFDSKTFSWKTPKTAKECKDFKLRPPSFQLLYESFISLELFLSLSPWNVSKELPSVSFIPFHFFSKFCLLYFGSKLPFPQILCPAVNELGLSSQK